MLYINRVLNLARHCRLLKTIDTLYLCLGASPVYVRRLVPSSFTIRVGSFSNASSPCNVSTWRRDWCITVRGSSFGFKLREKLGGDGGRGRATSVTYV